MTRQLKNGTRGLAAVAVGYRLDWAVNFTAERASDLFERK
jgi:hypothetical protein